MYRIRLVHVPPAVNNASIHCYEKYQLNHNDNLESHCVLDIEGSNANIDFTYKRHICHVCFEFRAGIQF